MKNKILCVFFATLLFSPLLLLAQEDDEYSGDQGEKQQMWIMRFKKMDVDHDQKLSQKEWIGAPGIFKRLDKNSDGYVDKDEILNFRQNAQGKRDKHSDRFQNMDIDRDGKISRKEWKASGDLFEHLDRDGDGYISRDEISQSPRGEDQRRQKQWNLIKNMDSNDDDKVTKDEWGLDSKIFERLDQNRDGSLTKEEFLTTGLEKSAWSRLELLDNDKDGKISQKEWKGKPEFFKRLDKNADGYITADEFSVLSLGSTTHSYNWDNIKLLDSNKDNKIAQEEWKGPAQVFKRIDKNADGYITKDEIPNGDEFAEQEADEATQSEVDKATQSEEKLVRDKKGIFKMDTDGDGKISKQEWKWSGSTFDRLDTDRDGFITQEEYDRFSPTSPHNRGIPSATRRGKN